MTITHSEQVTRVHLASFSLIIRLSNGGLVNVWAQNEAILVHFGWVVRHITDSGGKRILCHYVFLDDTTLKRF